MHRRSSHAARTEGEVPQDDPKSLRAITSNTFTCKSEKVALTAGEGRTVETGPGERLASGSESEKGQEVQVCRAERGTRGTNPTPCTSRARRKDSDLFHPKEMMFEEKVMFGLI